MDKRLFTAICIGMAAISLSACGGGGGDDDEDDAPTVPDASGAGIWTGPSRVDGTSVDQPFQGLVTEEGDYAFTSFGTTTFRQFFGTGSTNGKTFSANAVTYVNGARSVPASMQGTIVDQVSINGSYSINGESATFALAYQGGTYLRPASLALLQGVYSTPSLAATIEASGAMTINLPGGCTLSATVTVPHANRNYYRFTGSFASCSRYSGPTSGLISLIDAPPGQNNRILLFAQNQPQTWSDYIVATK